MQLLRPASKPKATLPKVGTRKISNSSSQSTNRQVFPQTYEHGERQQRKKSKVDANNIVDQQHEFEAINPQKNGTKKNFIIRKNNYMEDQMGDSKITVKKEEPQQMQMSRASTVKKSDLQVVGVLDWSNSEPSDNEVKKKRQLESQVPLNPMSKTMKKDARMNFLDRMSAFKQIDDNLLEREQQIIREVETQIYKAQNIKIIQAQIRMKKARKNYLKVRQQMKEEGNLLASDELKLKKFQRFVRNKMASLRVRAVTRKVVAQIRLRKYPNKEQAALQKVSALFSGLKARNQFKFVITSLKQKQYKTIRQSICQPLYIDEFGNEAICTLQDSYIFTLALHYPDYNFIKFSLIPKFKKVKQVLSLEIDLDNFLNSLGLLQQYIDSLESYSIMESELTKTLKQLQSYSFHFINLNQIQGKYKVESNLENNQQLEFHLTKISPFLQNLVFIDEKEKLIIKGINNFEYNQMVPIKYSDPEKTPPIYLRMLDENQINKIKLIQAKMRAYLQKAKMTRIIQMNKRNLLSTDVFQINHEYISVNKVIENRTQKKYIYIVDLINRRKTNDLLYEPIVFRQVKELNQENLSEIFHYELKNGLLEYSEEAQYWISKQRDHQAKDKIGSKEDSYSRSASIIQRRILGYLARRQLQIMRFNSQSEQLNKKKEITKKILVKRAMIYGDGTAAKASLTTFYLFTEKVDPNKSIMGESEYQSVMLTSKSMEHIYAFDKVAPFFQRLFYVLQEGNLRTIAQKMVDYSKILKSKKEGFKVWTKNLDEVQGEIMNEGREVQKGLERDITLVARTKLNQKFRINYLSQQEHFVTDYEDTRAQYETIESTYKQLLFVKKIQELYKKHLNKLGQQINAQKQIKDNDLESIQNYVNNFLPTTEYGTDNAIVEKQLLKQKTSKQLFKDSVQLQLPSQAKKRQTLLIQESVVMFNDTVQVDSVEMMIRILYSVESQQFIIVGDVAANRSYKTMVSYSQLFQEEEIQTDYLRENISSLLLNQLHYLNETLYVKINPELIKEFLNEHKLLYQTFRQQEQDKKNEQEESLDKELALPPNTIRISQLGKGQFVVDYLYSKINKTISVIYWSSQHPDKQYITIDTTDFGSKYVDTVLPQLTDRKIQQFFHDFSISIHRLLVINKDMSTNFNKFRLKLPTLLQERFVQKIQGMLHVKKMVEKLKMYKKLKQPKLFMHKFVENQNQQYVEVIYFLYKTKYQLRIIVKELSFVTAQGHIVEKSKTLKSKRRLREKCFCLNLKEVTEPIQMTESLRKSKIIKKQQNADLNRIDLKVFGHYDQMKTIEYYRQLFTPLIQIIQKNLVIHYQPFIFEFKTNLPIEEIQQRTKTANQNYYHPTIGSIAFFALKLQGAIRRMQNRNWFELKYSRLKELSLKNKYLGEFVKRTYKKILKKSEQNEQELFYLVNIYKREGKTKGSIKFTYELVQQKQSKSEYIKQGAHLRGTYVWEPQQMLNIKEMRLCDYILQLLQIEDGIIRFREQELVEQEIEEQYSEVKEEDQYPVQQRNLISEEVNEKLIAHEERPDSLYNVVYTGSKTIKNRKLQSEQDNQITLEVSLKNLRKLYPNMNIKNKETMKIVSSNLISGIQINEGKIQVDQSRIQTSFINVQKSKIVSQRPSSQASRVLRPSRPHFKQDIIKTTVSYAGEKYLLVIYYIERKINKILQSNHDQVFQEFERVFQVQATNLVNLGGGILWEFTLEEGEILTHQQGKEKICGVLAKRIQVLNGKFIYLCFCEEDILKLKIEDPNIILFVEATIQPIQRRFKDRRLRQNYQYYREIIKQYKEHKIEIYREINNLNSKMNDFIVLSAENEHKKINVFAWEFMDQFDQFDIEVPRQRFASMMLEDKTVCLKVLIKFITFNQNERKLKFSIPKPELVYEYFEEEKKLRSFHHSASSPSPNKMNAQFRQFSYRSELDSPKSVSPDLQPMDFQNIDEVEEKDHQE